MVDAPIVYLDTQDYSRFGRVIEGKGAEADEFLYRRLNTMADNGEVIFACSLPILSELLSYNEKLPRITDAKAEAVEALCRGYALRCPTEIVALEVGWLAYANNLIATHPKISALNENYHWLPETSDLFEGLRQQIHQNLNLKIDGTGLNRAGRRRLKKKATTDLDFSRTVDETSFEIERNYGFPADAVKDSVGLYLQGQISSVEATRRVSATFARPTNFVNINFKRDEGEKTLSSLMGGLGRDLDTELSKVKAAIELLPARTESDRMILRSIVQNKIPEISATVLNLAQNDIITLGVSKDVLAYIAASSELTEQVLSSRIVARLYIAYICQIIGLLGTASNVEKSVAGDLIHSAYIGHVDLWRTDRRFGHLAASTFPEYALKIVPRASDLPNAIEQVNRSHASRTSSVSVVCR